MVGIIQEQHPERARLFMQWKQMGWPVLVDSLNLLGVSVVPITLLIDEYGVIRQVQPPLAEAAGHVENFLAQRYERPAGVEPAPASVANLDTLKAATEPGGVAAWRAYGDALFLWGGAERAGEAIAAYQQALGLEPGDAPTHFRVGVAYRQRYDSDYRQATDFQKAVEHWARALALEPNQYICRRRIQQYAARLDKPYPFYDWVHTARKEIAARGEPPVALAVEPSGAELAAPTKTFRAGPGAVAEPDGAGRIVRDPGRLITIETAVVPPTIAPGSAARVHVVLRPNQGLKAHWNNEVDELVFWVNPPPGWLTDSRSLTVPNPPQPVSQETRKVEFELRCPEDAAAGSVRIPSYALYYVCEDVNGTCLYQRQDVVVQVQVVKSKP